MQPTQIIDLSTIFWEGVKLTEVLVDIPVISSSAREVTIAVSAAQLEALIEQARKLAAADPKEVRKPLRDAASKVFEKFGKRAKDAIAQGKFREERHKAGLKEVRGIWADPALHAAIKVAASSHVGENGWVAGLNHAKSQVKFGGKGGK